MAALLSGSLVWAWSRFLFNVPAPYLLALAAAFAAYIAVGLMEPRHGAARNGANAKVG